MINLWFSNSLSMFHQLLIFGIFNFCVLHPYTRNQSLYKYILRLKSIALKPLENDTSDNATEAGTTTETSDNAAEADTTSANTDNATEAGITTDNVNNAAEAGTTIVADEKQLTPSVFNLKD